MFLSIAALGLCPGRKTIGQTPPHPSTSRAPAVNVTAHLALPAQAGAVSFSTVLSPPSTLQSPREVTACGPCLEGPEFCAPFPRAEQLQKLLRILHRRAVGLSVPVRTHDVYFTLSYNPVLSGWVRARAKPAGRPRGWVRPGAWRHPPSFQVRPDSDCSPRPPCSPRTGGPAGAGPRVLCGHVSSGREGGAGVGLPGLCPGPPPAPRQGQPGFLHH